MSAKTTEQTNHSNAEHSVLGGLLIDAGQDFYQRGWMLGTSGNLSAVVSSDPLTLAITASGAAKGALTPNHILLIDGLGKVKQGEGRSSDETRLHLAVVRNREAGAVLHTHSVWSTLLSNDFASKGSLLIEGFEMLKGLSGVSTHEHSELVPIIENSQDMESLSVSLEEALTKYPKAHGVLLRRHGLYTWGRDVAEARRHVEILEFLFEVTGRSHLAGASGTP
ncbi:MAG TPA: methylthioribulose 1-phosphate dehydratase [Pyrinomonadaceae bacterium]|jgi:methylthioribulose-1-phosphate dehydratase|nr:methylthioribulose 1-phosphate dehydratase [Pyrinomonadaceae bacterium]